MTVTKRHTSRNKHSKNFQPLPAYPVPAVPQNWDALTITGRVVKTGNMVESWFGKQVPETRTVYTIQADDATLAEGVDYDTAYAFIQNATKGYRADECRTPLNMLKNACGGDVSGGYNTVTISKASDEYQQNVGGSLSFGYYMAEAA